MAERGDPRRMAALALSAVLALMLCSLPFWDPKVRRVALTVYGPRPLGVSWQAFHVLAALLLSLPMPAFWYNLLLA